MATKTYLRVSDVSDYRQREQAGQIAGVCSLGLNVLWRVGRLVLCNKLETSTSRRDGERPLTFDGINTFDVLNANVICWDSSYNEL